MDKNNILFEIAKSTTDNFRKENNISSVYLEKEKIKKAIEAIMTNEEHINELKEILLTENVQKQNNSLEIITEFYSECGFTDESKKLCAKILKKFFEDIGEERTFELLKDINSKDRFFWIFLGILSSELGIYPFSPEFVSNWFLDISEMIKDDLAAGQFYQGIEDYSYSFPLLANKVISLLLEGEMDELKISLSSLILGSIRANIEFSKDEIFRSLENDLKTSNEYKVRIIYYRSFCFTYNKTGINISELNKILNQMNQDIDLVKEQQYYIFERIICYNSNNTDLIDCFLHSINKIKDNISEMGQYNISASLRWIGWKFKEIDIIELPRKLNDILKKILPISLKNKRTWKLIEDYLRSLYEFNRLDFNEAFIILIDYSFNEFKKIFYEEFDILEHTLVQDNYNEFIFYLLISGERSKRKFGFSLAQRLGLTIPEEIIEKGLIEYQLKLLLYSTGLYYVATEKVGDFILTIEPLYRNVNQELKKEFIQEMVFQAINFPGVALNKWEKIGDKSEMLLETIDIAKKYFDNLHKTNDIAANSYVYPQVIKGEEQWVRRTSNAISQGAKAKSVLLRNIRSTNLLYGNLWIIYNFNEPFKEPSSLKRYSNSFEYPSLEISDPEGMLIRRINLQKKISELQNE
ncbi:MAG TPA: hypothetical protein PL089_14925 [Ignavibacteria bacterium]|nr:hypothetical protein [Ignavibacteria bacterium]